MSFVARLTSSPAVEKLLAIPNSILGPKHGLLGIPTRGLGLELHSDKPKGLKLLLFEQFAIHRTMQIPIAHHHLVVTPRPNHKRQRTTFI